MVEHWRKYHITFYTKLFLAQPNKGTVDLRNKIESVALSSTAILCWKIDMIVPFSIRFSSVLFAILTFLMLRIRWLLPSVLFSHDDHIYCDVCLTIEPEQLKPDRECWMCVSLSKDTIKTQELLVCSRRDIYFIFILNFCYRLKQ